MKLFVAVLGGLLLQEIGARAVRFALWPVFWLGGMYDAALGPYGFLALFVGMPAGAFFGGVVATYLPLRWFPDIDPGRVRAWLVGVVVAINLLSVVVSALATDGAVSYAVLTFLRVGSAILGFSVGIAMVADGLSAAHDDERTRASSPA